MYFWSKWRPRLPRLARPASTERSRLDREVGPGTSPAGPRGRPEPPLGCGRTKNGAPPHSIHRKVGLSYQDFLTYNPRDSPRRACQTVPVSGSPTKFRANRQVSPAGACSRTMTSMWGSPGVRPGLISGSSPPQVRPDHSA